MREKLIEKNRAFLRQRSDKTRKNRVQDVIALPALLKLKKKKERTKNKSFFF